MRSAIDARNRAISSRERCRGAILARGGGGGFLNAGMGAHGPAQMGRQQSMAVASEQYRHNAGWVHSIIKIIAQRIAAQPMRIARVVKAEEKRQLLGILSKGNPFRKELARARLAQLKARAPRKGEVPAFVKEYRQQVEVLEDHPILDIMRRPNPIMVRSVLMHNTVASLELTGRAYWWFCRPGEPGSPAQADGPNGGVEIWPLPSSWVEPVHEEKKLFASWSVTPPGGGEPIKVAGGQIGCMYYPDPSNPLGFLAPLQAQSRAVVVDEAALEAQRRGMANGLYPGLALIVGRDPDISGMPGARPVLKKDQRAQIIAAVKQAYRGVQNNEEPIILDGLITDAKPVTTSPREMAFMETGKMSKERLTQGWSVNPISMGQVEGANRACHDSETELLTLRGWLRYGDVKIGDVAGTMNQTSGAFEWQPISHVHIYEGFNGQMVRLAGTKIDALVTPDHRMWFKRDYIGGRKVKGSWGFKQAGDLKCHDILPLSPGPKLDGLVGDFILPGVMDRGGARKNGPLLCAVVPIKPFAEFIGWFVSEGWTVAKPRGGHAVSVCQTIDAQEECRRIFDCMTRLGLRKLQVVSRKGSDAEWNEDGYARKPRKTFTLNDKRLWAWMRDNCGHGSHTKQLPTMIRMLPASLAELTLEAMLLGDGSHRKPTERKNYSDGHASYFSVSRRLMDDVQSLAVMCGRAARMRKTMSHGVHSMCVSSVSSQMSLLPKHISREHYEGTVWCVTVPNGLIVTRRNGKTLVSGNSSATADDHFVANVINPRLEMMSEVLTRWLPPLVQDDVPDDEQLVYFEPAQSHDPDLELTQMTFMAAQAAISRNEIRARYGYPPIEDGDSIFLPGFGEVMIAPAEQEAVPGLDEPPDRDGDRGFPIALGGMGRARFLR